jgi:hypothetical protein
MKTLVDEGVHSEQKQVTLNQDRSRDLLGLEIV